MGLPRGVQAKNGVARLVATKLTNQAVLHGYSLDSNNVISDTITIHSIHVGWLKEICIFK
jgi:hypothetical protein